MEFFECYSWWKSWKYENKNRKNVSKKRNEQSKKNKKKLIEIHNKEIEENASNKNRLDVLNESDDIGIKNGKKNNSNNQINNNNTKTKKKKKRK